MLVSLSIKGRHLSLKSTVLSWTKCFLVYFLHNKNAWSIDELFHEHISYLYVFVTYVIFIAWAGPLIVVLGSKTYVLYHDILWPVIKATKFIQKLFDLKL